MLRSLSHANWQVLRKVLRDTAGTKRGTPGLGLRMAPTIRTRNGTFLLDLEEQGLLNRAGQDTQPKDAFEPLPEAFLIRWRLTPLGEHAAEYGEFEDSKTGVNLPTPEEFARNKGGGLKRAALKV